MSGAIYQVASGAVDYQLNLEMIANNLANVDTVGFKAEQAFFRLPDQVQGKGDGQQDRASMFLSLIPPGTVTDLSQGQLQLTGNSLDLAIEGRGFFTVQTPEGTRFTRKGDFSLDANGRLVTQEGYAVLGEGGEITLRGEHISIGQDGTVTVDDAAAGRLRIVDFADQKDLKKEGDCLFAKVDPNTPETPAQGSNINQGFLERSNVDMLQAMTEMIEVSRGFQAYQKMIQALDDIRGKAVNDLGRLA